MPTNVFIFITRDIIYRTAKLLNNEIGIMESEAPTSCSIMFVRIQISIDLPRRDFRVFDPALTGDMFPKKVCNVCHRLCSTTEFPKNQNGKNNRIIRRPTCNHCREPMDGMRLSLTEKRFWEKSKPYLERFECPICLKVTIPGLTSKVVLDHNHANGKARGWICDSCNTGVGRFKDDINLLKTAIKYLQKG